MSKILLFLASLLIILSLTFAACQPAPAQPAVEAPAKEEPAKAEQPAEEVEEPTKEEAMEEEVKEEPMDVEKGGDLVLAYLAKVIPRTLDAQIVSAQIGWVFTSFIADPLVVWTEEGTYELVLAESYEANADNTEHTFTLKQGLVFQDGTPINAEAAAFNFERIQPPEAGSMFFANVLGAEYYKVEVIDEYTFKITYDRPWPKFSNTIRRYPIYSAEAIKKYGDEFVDHLIGHGPYMFKEYVADDHILLERWDDYPGTNPLQDHEGPAYLDTIRLNFIGEPVVLGMLIATDDAHIATDMPIQSAMGYVGQGIGEVKVTPQQGDGMGWIINTSRPPLDQLEVRQALLYATDRELANEIAYDGLFPLVYGPFSSSHPCYWDGAEEMYKPDLEKAKQLLEDAGWKDEDGDGIREAHGVPGVADLETLTFDMNSYSDRFQPLMEELQLQWQEAGFDMQIRIIPTNLQRELSKSGEFNVMIAYLVDPDPQLAVTMWYGPYAGETGRWSWSRLDIDELDSALEDLMASGDGEERCELAKVAQQIVMENAACIPVVDMPIIRVVSNKVKGLKNSQDPFWLYINDVYIEE